MDRQMISIIVLGLSTLFFGSIAIMDDLTDRSWEDGVEKAERHHLITGGFYNKYNQVVTRDTNGIITNIDYEVVKRASFQETYWKELKEYKK